MSKRDGWDDKRKKVEIEYTRTWRTKYPAKAMISRCRARASRKGIEFDLTEADIFIPTHCPVLGIELRIQDSDTAPSLDRIDPARGYVPGNVIVISNRANRLKNNGTPAELLAIAKFFGKLQS